MALCYHKETFIIGFVTAYLLFGVVTFFEDVIFEWVRRIRGLL